MAGGREGSGEERGRKPPSQWSPWEWNTDGYWVCHRKKWDGELEYSYEYPERTSELLSNDSQHSCIPVTSAESTDASPSSNTATFIADNQRVNELPYLNSGPIPATLSTIPDMSSGVILGNGLANCWSPDESGITYQSTDQSDSTSVDDLSFYNMDSLESALASTYSTASLSSQPHYPLDPHIDETRTSQRVEHELDSQFEAIHDGRRFFKVGRVFKVVWSEPAGVSTSNDDILSSETRLGETVISKIRRFVVVKKNRRHCICHPLLTYGGQATMKPGVSPAEHAAVFANKGAAKYLPGEEAQLVIKPFGIILEAKDETLDPLTRINFAKLYTVEHNIKVCKIGRIDDGEVKRLSECSQQVMWGRSADGGNDNSLSSGPSKSITTTISSQLATPAETPGGHFHTERSYHYEWFWYCCRCGDGPWSCMGAVQVCPCGPYRCEQCPTEQRKIYR